MFSQPIAQWLGKLRVVEDADLTRVQVVGHCLRVAKVWNRSLDDQPVIAAEDAHDLIGKSVGKQLRTHIARYPCLCPEARAPVAKFLPAEPEPSPDSPYKTAFLVAAPPGSGATEPPPRVS